jgi:hypothetical protein
MRISGNFLGSLTASRATCTGSVRWELSKKVPIELAEVLGLPCLPLFLTARLELALDLERLAWLDCSEGLAVVVSAAPSSGNPGGKFLGGFLGGTGS